MPAITTIDFCCGRTQHDTCSKCGRNFNAPHFTNELSPGSKIPAPP